MTSLTPNRDAVRAGLEAAKLELETLALTPAGQHERRMSFDVMEASMLAAADMVDAGLGERVREAIESSFANALLSHAMNLAGGDRQRAVGIIVELASDIGSTALSRLVRNRPDVEVNAPVAQSQAGNA